MLLVGQGKEYWIDQGWVSEERKAKLYRRRGDGEPYARERKEYFQQGKIYFPFFCFWVPTAALYPIFISCHVNAMLSLLHSHQNQSWITVLGSHSTAIDKISSAQHLYLSISQSLVTIDYHGTIISPCSSDISLYYRVVNRKTVLSGLFYNNC